jgi:hypothetical protein
MSERILEDGTLRLLESGLVRIDESIDVVPPVTVPRGGGRIPSHRVCSIEFTITLGFDLQVEITWSDHGSWILLMS